MSGSDDSTSWLKQSGVRIMNGGIAGFVGTGVIFPLDLSKTRLQEQTKASIKTASNTRYKNMFDCMFKVARYEGVRNLYKGLAVNLTLVMPEKAIKLAVNDQLRYSYGSRNGSILPIHQEMISGAMSGFCQVVVTTPMEFLKIQMQMANKFSSKSVTAFQLTRNLIAENGIKAIYRGLMSTLFRDVTFSVMYFPGFAYLNRIGFGPNNEKPYLYHTLFSGLISGSISAFMVTPFDVIKTRLQFIGNKETAIKYNGFADCVRQTYANDGLRAFFKGSVPRMIVIAPLFGIAQTVYFLGIAEKILGIH